MSSIIGSQRREAKATPRGRSLRRRVAAAASAALVGLWASAACAEGLLFGANPGFVTFMAPTILDLNGPATGGTQLTFATTQANQRVAITFNAFCAVISQPDGNGGGPGTVLIEILVDPAGSVGESALPRPRAGGTSALVGTIKSTG